ncbi:tryptophan synthase subunit alpha [Candidatus Vidania fulgoroideorum]
MVNPGFIPFIIGNYPNNNKFVKILKFLEKIKFLEIGIPFSEPYSDGKTISSIYRKMNFSFDYLLKNIKISKNNSHKILVCYSNFIENIGEKVFFYKIKYVFKHILIVDQPLKYLVKYKKYFIKYKVKCIHIVSNYNNINKNYLEFCSFIYLTNYHGTTGKKKKN